MREIEVKIKAADLAEVEKQLVKRGCFLGEPLRQHDTVYSLGGEVGVWQAAKAGDIILRLRRENERAIFTLKEQRSSESDNIEYETAISDPAAMHRILLKLGYRPEVEVKKVRRKGKFNCYEICLDQVEELGSFVELEKITAEDDDPAAVREELLGILESLGLNRADEQSHGYDTQIFFKHRGAKS